mgnify:FL=1
MKKQIKKVAVGVVGVVAVGVLIGGLATSVISYGATSKIGAEGAFDDSQYSLQDMIRYAVEDEYLAQAEYDVDRKSVV